MIKAITYVLFGGKLPGILQHSQKMASELNTSLAEQFKLYNPKYTLTKMLRCQLNMIWRENPSILGSFRSALRESQEAVSAIHWVFGFLSFKTDAFVIAFESWVMPSAEVQRQYRIERGKGHCYVQHLSSDAFKPKKTVNGKQIFWMSPLIVSLFFYCYFPHPTPHSTACMIFILDISFYSGLPSPFFNPLGWIERSCSLSCWLNWKKVLPLQHDPRRSHGMFLLDIVRFAAKTRMCWLILGEAPFPSSAKPELSAMGRSLWGHTQKRTAQCFWKQLAKTPLGLSSHPPHFFLSQWISGKHRCVIYLVLYNKFSQTTDLKQYTFIIWYFYRLGIHTQLSWVLFQTIL